MYFSIFSSTCPSNSPYGLCCAFAPGADVQLGCGPDSPLHVAVREGGVRVVELLMDYGADGSCRNADRKTPLDLAAANSPVRTTLLSRGTRQGTPSRRRSRKPQSADVCVVLCGLLYLSPSFPQAPVLLPRHAGSLSVGVWVGVVSMAPLVSSSPSDSRPSSSTSEQPLSAPQPQSPSHNHRAPPTTTVGRDS